MIEFILEVAVIWEVLAVVCPNCGVYLIDREEICPSCGHVINDNEGNMGYHSSKDGNNLSDKKLDYSGVPVSKRVISTPSIGKARVGIRLIFLLLMIIPIVNVVAAFFGAYASKDLFIRRTAQGVIVLFFVIIVILGVYTYQYGIEFIVNNLINLINQGG